MSDKKIGLSFHTDVMLPLLFIFVLNFERQSTQTFEGLDFGGFAAWKKSLNLPFWYREEKNTFLLPQGKSCRVKWRV